ncbi:MAG: hypothetical protein ACK5O1_05875 [Holosporales bacterium]|jgi:hypothetical protein
MKLPKAFIIMLCIAGLLSSCELIENGKKNPESIPVLIAILPLYIVYQGIVGISVADDALTPYTKDFVKEAGGCLTPYDASIKDITDNVFVISDPVRCVDKNSDIRFNDNDIYYLGKDAYIKEETYLPAQIKGTAYQCQRLNIQNSHRFSCKTIREYTIDKMGKNYYPTSMFNLKTLEFNPAVHWRQSDTSSPRLELYSYKKECKQPLIKLPASTQEEILFGMFDDRYYSITGRACNFRLIRKIPRAAVIGY